MNTEFHYYLTGIIARAAGFDEDEAKVIAESSEYVDENDISLAIEDRASGEAYRNYISQTMNIFKPQREIMRIYPVFHFVPGDPLHEGARRTDGKMHLLTTTPDSEIAGRLLDEAFKASDENRLYRIGIATHTYADTWAHQNFVGWYDYFNNMGLDPKPDIGHANAEHHPDWMSHRWDDVRLVYREVDNNERFLQAGEKIYEKYRRYLGRIRRSAHSSWPALTAMLAPVFGKSASGARNWGEEDRLPMYRDLAPWLGEFNEEEWFDGAIDTEVKGLEDKKKGIGTVYCVFRDRYFWREDADREETHWFRFQESVKEHQSRAMELLKPVFDGMGLNLHDY